MYNFHPPLPAVNSIKDIVRHWPARSRKLARDIVRASGLPHEATDSMLIWYYHGPWKRTVVHREGAAHNFPRPHVDLLEQTIDYRVPVEKHSDLADFDGSIIVDRTRGEMSAHCDCEEMNRLMLNLAHDIVVGNKTPTQARQECGRIAAGLRLNWSDPYSEELRFSAGLDPQRETNTPDPDERVGALMGRARR
jgi:hypothetical protein